MNFPSETTNDKVALKARQRAYLDSLNAQITQQNRQQALDKIDEGHYVRNLPATPDFQSQNEMLLAPLPPVNHTSNNNPTPRNIGGGMRSIVQSNNPRRDRPEDYRRVGKSYESGVADVLGVYQGSQFEGNDRKTFDSQLQSYNDNSSYNQNQNQNQNPQQQNRNQKSKNFPNLDSADLNQLKQQLTNFMSHQQRTESTVKWLSDQLQKNRSDYAKHTSMLVNQVRKTRTQYPTFRAAELTSPQTCARSTKKIPSQFQQCGTG